MGLIKEAMTLEYSAAGLAKTKEFEGLRLAAYTDQGGVWTIGYGHTGPDVKPGMKIAEAEAEALLKKDVQWAVDCVNKAVRPQLNQNQFDALVDFTFNIGCGAFNRSNMLRLINAENLNDAAVEFTRWRFVKGTESAGLLRRRQADQKLFVTPV